MGCRILSSEGKTALFDSVTGIAFGPVMDDSDEAEAFVRFAERETNMDPRAVPTPELMAVYARFREEEWEAE